MCSGGTVGHGRVSWLLELKTHESSGERWKRTTWGPRFVFFGRSLKPLDFFPNLHKDYWILYEIHSFGSRKVLCFGIILLRQFGLLNLMIGEGYLVYAGWFNSRRSLEVTDNPWKGQPSQKGHELNRLVYRFCWWLIHSLGSRHFPPYDRKKWHTGVLEHSASRVFSCLKGSRPTWSNNKNQAETYSQL